MTHRFLQVGKVERAKRVRPFCLFDLPLGLTQMVLVGDCGCPCSMIQGNYSCSEVKKKIKELKETESTTPTTNCPLRERKSISRLLVIFMTLVFYASVVLKLSGKKIDYTLKLLHKILFGRRGKGYPTSHSRTILLHYTTYFSFHVTLTWNNEINWSNRCYYEKQMIKVKIFFDQRNKEKLLEFSDVLDIPVGNPNSRKARTLDNSCVPVVLFRCYYL
ncbi:transmembrane protein, putative [Medicago truncatula]|uniref:Transmembrane protein, putative n=1 Tax=Medicago truncatula TaxID=3880 RepID=G7K4R4_MEDTR|nr:transmembrane protein, putative [Medicago truncatula]